MRLRRKKERGGVPGKTRKKNLYTSRFCGIGISPALSLSVFSSLIRSSCFALRAMRSQPSNGQRPGLTRVAVRASHVLVFVMQISAAVAFGCGQCGCSCNSGSGQYCVYSAGSYSCRCHDSSTYYDQGTGNQRQAPVCHILDARLALGRKQLLVGLRRGLLQERQLQQCHIGLQVSTRWGHL